MKKTVAHQILKKCKEKMKRNINKQMKMK